MNVVGIILIVAGIIILLCSFSTKLLSTSYKTKWLVNLAGITATKIIYAVLGIGFIVLGIVLI